MNALRLSVIVCAFAASQCSGGSTSTSSTGAAADGGDAPPHVVSDAGASAPAPPQEAGAQPPADASAPAGSGVDAKLVLQVPSSWHGTPRELDVVVVPMLPVAGPPAGILYQAQMPQITAGQSLTIHGDASGIAGSNYVVAVLYMQGGGAFAPTPGVDYEAESTAPSTFDGKPVDLGQLSLTLVSPDGGP